MFAFESAAVELRGKTLVPPRGEALQVQQVPWNRLLLENYICLHDNRHLRECISERLYNKPESETGHFKYKEKEMKKKEKLSTQTCILLFCLPRVYAHGPHTTRTKSKR